MSALIRDLVDQVREACAEPRYAELKSMWTAHNRLQKAPKVPVYIHLHRGYTRTWREIIPPDVLVSADPLERDIELQLRQKLFRHRHIPDDEVLLPTIWLEPIRPADRPPLWGVNLESEDPDCPEGAYTFRPAVRDEADFAQLRQPHYQIDEPATAALVERARELVGDALPVKLLTNELHACPAESLVKFLGWESYLYSFLERPQFVHEMMGFLTDSFIAYQQEREAKGAVDAESSWPFRVHYEELGPDEPADRLRSCWLYVAAQSTGTISPAMYAEFVHPYNERIVGLYGEHRIYYHGCEDLTPKLDIIAQLPGLRRFDVGAWTDLAACVAKFERRVVLEVQVHPGKTILSADPAEMRRDLERIVSIAGDCIIDVNLSDVETVKGDPSILTTWARIAQEVTGG
ncbi:MAG: hypothetical protein M0Z94_10605 [Dehalococcoidales bacterium]|nr:hypothetical protein [Dehalococcoidales bacterium]